VAVVDNWAVTPEGNLWRAYGPNFQSFIDDIRGVFSITPPYGTLKTLWDTVSASYGFTGIHKEWLDGLLRAVVVSIEVSPGVFLDFVFTDTDIWLDLLNADDSAYGEQWLGVELATLPGYQGGPYDWQYEGGCENFYPAVLKFVSVG